jgi:hypothetical protein
MFVGWHFECRVPVMNILSLGMRVRFNGQANNPKNGQHCTIIRVLPNPSNRPESQWYDVRFDDDSMGRFLRRYLVEFDHDEKSAA